MPVAVPQEQPQGLFAAIGRGLWGISSAVMGVSSEDFEYWFSSRFKDPVPQFSKTSFGDAVKSALQQRRLLLVWLHQEDGRATEELARNVFQNPLVLRLVRRSFVLWAGDVNRFEPCQIARLLGASAFPSVVICEPLRHGFDTPGYCLEWPLGTFARPVMRMSPQAPREPLDCDQVFAAITMSAEEHQDEVHSQQVAREQRNLQLEEERLLREQQDREFEESLLADQLAEVRRREATSSPSSSPSEPAPANLSSPPASLRTEEPAVDEEQAAAEEQRKRRGVEILAKPEPAAGAGLTAKLSLRLPSGDRLQRTFLATTTLNDVYEWAHCCRAEALPAKFALCTSFPAKMLTERSATLEASGLVPNAALVLKPVE